MAGETVNPQFNLQLPVAITSRLDEAKAALPEQASLFDVETHNFYMKWNGDLIRVNDKIAEDLRTDVDSNAQEISVIEEKLDTIERGAQKNTVLGIKGNAETTYRTGSVNITPANIGLGKVDNTADADKHVLTSKRLVNPYITIQTGSSKQQKITLQTLMNWLVNIERYIPIGTACSLVIQTTWAYADNDVLQLTVNGVNYELQLAGVVIEFMGYVEDYQTGVFRLRIHSSPTTDFTVSSGYSVFPVDHIAEYTCNGKDCTPTWKMISCAGDNASSASKLATARSLKVDLASSADATFDGSEDQTSIPVGGVLPAANGGTGKSTLVDSANVLINALTTDDSDPTDADYYIAQYAGGGAATTTFHRRPISKLWDYIKAKLSITSSGTGNAITGLSYKDGVFTVTKASTFLTSHQDISGKANSTDVGYSLGVSGTTVSLKNNAGKVLSSIDTQDTITTVDTTLSTTSANPVTNKAVTEALNGKAASDHTHDYSSVYAAKNHTHDDYAAINHTHDYSGVFAAINHTHDYSSVYAALNHNHDAAYAAKDHTHSNYASTSVATQNDNGLMSAADKKKLDSITAGGSVILSIG